PRSAPGRQRACRASDGAIQVNGVGRSNRGGRRRAVAAFTVGAAVVAGCTSDPLETIATRSDSPNIPASTSTATTSRPTDALAGSVSVTSAPIDDADLVVYPDRIVAELNPHV